ncbi:gas vesicle protein [Streptomyces sp. NA04227]|uniref:gas vesicle protein GvpO n=1 Tax=Streptomyces sp. NA04227 TaxID=2742136 RepID=UPI001590E196|nr:gas vesicle protein [Streptomyces sp. NA04227]QKW10389.1 gas vesicle protein [Streptomyces sp. NA04227]
MSTTEDERDNVGEDRIGLSTAMRYAADQLAELLRCEPGSVSVVKATDDGWSAEVEIVELERVPDPMSVLASYRVALDPQGRMLAYERVRRYANGRIDRR